MAKTLNTGRSQATLVGLWFHSFEEAAESRMRWQGQIVGKETDALYLVQLFEWLDGDPTVLRLVPVTEIFKWHLYATNEDMQNGYQRYEQRRRSR